MEEILEEIQTYRRTSKINKNKNNIYTIKIINFFYKSLK